MRLLLVVLAVLLSPLPACAEYTWFLGVNNGQGWRVARVFENKWECEAERKKREEPGVIVRCAFWKPGLTPSTMMPRTESEPPKSVDRDAERQRILERAQQRQEEAALRERRERTEYCNRNFGPREREKCMKGFEPVRR